MRYISVGNLREGMELAKGFHHSGVIGLVEGRALSELDIKKLGLLGVTGLWVRDHVEYCNGVTVRDTVTGGKFFDGFFDSLGMIFGGLVKGGVRTGDFSALQSYILRNRLVLNEMMLLRGNHYYTYAHSLNVAFYAMRMGLGMGLGDRELMDLVIGSLLHDIGKISVRNSILDKPTRLDMQEFEEIRRHPEYGLRMVQDMRGVTESSCDIVVGHHEKLDGSGYPYGLSGDRLGLLVRIVTVADMFDAMSAGRSYKDGYDVSHVVQELELESQRGKLDAGVFELFKSSVVVLGEGVLVWLSEGLWGFVLEDCTHMRPKVYVPLLKRVVDLLLDDRYDVVRVVS